MQATPREGTKVEWSRSLIRSKAIPGETQFVNCQQSTLQAAGTVSGPWRRRDGALRLSLPTGAKTHRQQVTLWLHQQVPLSLYGNLGSFISHNVGRSPESPITTEAFIWTVHFLEPISFSHFRPFHQMGVLAWWQVQKGAWSKTATVPEVKTQTPTSVKDLSPLPITLLIDQKTSN